MHRLDMLYQNTKSVEPFSTYMAVYYFLFLLLGTEKHNFFLSIRGPNICKTLLLVRYKNNLAAMHALRDNILRVLCTTCSNPLNFL